MFTKPVKTVLVRDSKAIDLLNKQAELEDRMPNYMAVKIIREALTGPNKLNNTNHNRFGQVEKSQ